MTTKKKLWTVNAIKDANRAAGGHWFDPDAMRAFGTSVLPEAYQGPGGVFFVTRDKQFDGTLGFTVRTFDPETGDVGSAETGHGVGELTRVAALSRAKEKALGGRVVGFSGKLVPPEEGGVPYELRGVTTTTEEFRPVSVLEQFVADLRAHGSSVAAPGSARELIRLAGRHHAQAEHACNGTGRISERTRDAIRSLALSLGASGVVFSGDPRGCTVKLTFADGATNDFGGEGWCVPTSEKLDG